MPFATASSVFPYFPFSIVVLNPHDFWPENSTLCTAHLLNLPNLGSGLPSSYHLFPFHATFSISVTADGDCFVSKKIKRIFKLRIHHWDIFVWVNMSRRKTDTASSLRMRAVFIALCNALPPISCTALPHCATTPRSLYCLKYHVHDTEPQRQACNFRTSFSHSSP